MLERTPYTGSHQKCHLEALLHIPVLCFVVAQVSWLKTNPLKKSFFSDTQLAVQLLELVWREEIMSIKG